MKKIITILGAVLFCAFTACGQNDIEATTYVKSGMAVPEFTVEMLDGTVLSTADMFGKVVLVNFWATWCPPCRKEFERLQADIVDRFAGRDFILLPISIDDDIALVEKFMDRSGYAFPVAFDKNKSVYGEFAGKYVPRNFVIGKDGTVKHYTVGYTPEDFDELIKIIEALL